jgi:hypothetical protein
MIRQPSKWPTSSKHDLILKSEPVYFLKVLVYELGSTGGKHKLHSNKWFAMLANSTMSAGDKSLSVQFLIHSYITAGITNAPLGGGRLSRRLGRWWRKVNKATSGIHTISPKLYRNEISLPWTQTQDRISNRNRLTSIRFLALCVMDSAGCHRE